MRVALFQAVRQQFDFRCGYCGLHETDAGATLTIDHFQPRTQGGQDVFDNLVYACHACNQHKSDHWDPESIERILHPVRDGVAAHFSEQDDGTLQAHTDTGAFHINRLQLNRPPLVQRRLRLRQHAQDREEYAQATTLFREVRTLIQELQQAIAAIRSGGE